MSRQQVYSRALTYTPLVPPVALPTKVLYLERFVSRPALVEVPGRFFGAVARPGVPSASVTYSVRLGPVRPSRVPVYLYRDGSLISVAQTDERGTVTFDLPVDRVGVYSYTVSLLPNPTLGGPLRALQDRFTLSVWYVRCMITNINDEFHRRVGRSFNEPLPRDFWSRKPETVVGWCTTGSWFADMVPVLGGTTATIEYGIDAPPRPIVRCPFGEWFPCIVVGYEPRLWRFDVMCYNGVDRRVFSEELNIDRHLEVTLEARDARSRLVVRLPYE